MAGSPLQFFSKEGVQNWLKM